MGTSWRAVGTVSYNKNFKTFLFLTAVSTRLSIAIFEKLRKNTEIQSTDRDQQKKLNKRSGTSFPRAQGKENVKTLYPHRVPTTTTEEKFIDCEEKHMLSCVGENVAGHKLKRKKVPFREQNIQIPMTHDDDDDDDDVSSVIGTRVTDKNSVPTKWKLNRTGKVYPR